ncbi:general transcription factor II-I repeat domain-containing protein 2-like [Tachysurus ichikawai]
MKIVENICPEKKQEFAKVCLAHNTVVRRIEDVSSDINRQLEAKAVKEFDFFSLSGDESTDTFDTAQLLIFLRAVDNEMIVSENLLDLQSLKDQTRGTDLFASVCSAVDDMKLSWNKVTGIITDGAPAKAGERSGLATLVCNKVNKEGVIKTINYIRTKALCHRQFQQFLLDIQAEYGDVVYHNDPDLAYFLQSRSQYHPSH